jgi:MraZ protein
MLSRKTQYAWMAMGGLICLFGLVLACKLRDGSKAVAQVDKPAPPPMTKEDPAPPLSPPVSLPPSMDKLESADLKIVTPSMPEKTPAPKKGKDSKSLSPQSKPDTLSVPAFPLDAKSANVKPLENPPPPAPLASGMTLPASFGPNAPTPPKTEKTAGPPMKPPSDPLLGSPPPPAPMPSGKTSTPPVPIGLIGSLPLPNKGTDVKPTDPKPAPPPPLEKARPSVKDTPPPSPPLPYHDSKPVAPISYAPTAAAAPSAEHETKPLPGEPPLAPAPGPVQVYRVHSPETLQDIARRTLGSAERSSDLHKLNPTLKPDAALRAGTVVRLPGDACVQTDDAEPVKPLPALRPKPTPPKAKVLPLTGTFQCSLDEKHHLTLPRALRDQLADSDTILVSPGPDKCLWLTNQSHLERLAERLEQSQANEADVRVFKRLYFAQTEKLSVSADGRIAVPERLAQFAGLHQELVLVGIDDHFEVWDAARWRQYTQRKSAVGRSAALAEPE